MPHLLLLAATTGYQTRSFADAARRRGMDITLATDRCHILENPWGDNAIPVRFERPLESAELINRTLRARVDGIAAVADRPTVAAAITAAMLGIKWHPPQAAEACRDKHQARRLFMNARLPSPFYRRVSIYRDPHELLNATQFPCVLKPLGLSASTGVIRANSPPEFLSAFARIRAIVEGIETDSPPGILIERYIPGREFALEGLMTDGELRVLAIFDKPDPLEGPFFEETIYVTPSREPAAIQQAIVETTAKACTALGLHHGPVHAEMRVNESGVYMLEVAARPIGGLCARSLRFRSGEDAVTLEELVILHAIGRMPEELAPASPASGVMMIPVPREGVFEGLDGVEEARAVPGIVDVVITAKTGETLTPLPEGAGYPGFIFANGVDPAFIENALRRAHECLRFRMLAALRVV